MPNEQDLVYWVRILALLHLGPICASLSVPTALQWDDDLQCLKPIHRQMHWAYGSYIFLAIIFFTLTGFFCARAIAHGGSLAVAYSFYGALFWTGRIPLQWIFDISPYLKTRRARIGYHLLSLNFIALAAGFIALLVIQIRIL